MGNIYKEQAEVLTKGEHIYLKNLKEELEKDHLGEYVAIDVDTGIYILDPNRLALVKKAQAQFGDKLFYTVQIGNLSEPTINFRERQNVSWIFT